MDVVNDQDEVIGQASKKEVYEKLLTHRIAEVFVFNDAGELLLQKRSANCSYCPLHWSMSAAGHVDTGETYEQAIHREMQEEIGVDLPLTFVGKEYYTEDPRNVMKFIAVFQATSNGPFNVNPQEVDSVAFFPLDRVREMIKNGEPFHPQMKYMLARYFK